MRADCFDCDGLSCLNRGRAVAHNLAAWTSGSPSSLTSSIGKALARVHRRINTTFIVGPR